MNHRTGGKLSLALLAVCTLLLLGAMAQALGFYHRMAYPLEYQALIEAAAAQYDLPPELLYAVTRTESSFNPQVESSVGARGLMQMTRDTADWAEFRKGTGQDLDVAYDRLFEPEANIQCGAFILRLLIDEFGTVDNALAAYHAGWGNVKKWLADEEHSSDGVNLSSIPFGDTARYVKKVNETSRIYRELYQFE